jgi:CheY-like chemotaxis protein
MQDVPVLVVDDNPDNQRIIRFLLEDTKARVTTADNGRIAVDAVAAATASGNPFKLIFMDMQMPVMDGYQATMTLRELGVKTPIVALTAFTLANDQKKCLEAGCNYYLTKPILPGEFYATLRAAMTGGPGPVTTKIDPSQVTPPSTTSTAPQAPSPNGRLISTMANNTRFAPLLAEYLAAVPENAKLIEQAVQAWDLDTLKIRLHRIKGTASSYGFPQIGQAAATCEAALRNNEARPLLEPKLQQFVTLLRQAIVD